jgi:hypothetical protein
MELKNLVLLMIVDIIALSLTGTVGSAVTTAQANANITGAVDTVTGLTTMLWIVCIIGANIGVLYKMFKG